MAMTGDGRLSTSSTSATDFSRPTSNGATAPGKARRCGSAGPAARRRTRPPPRHARARRAAGELSSQSWGNLPRLLNQLTRKLNTGQGPRQLPTNQGSWHGGHQNANPAPTPRVEVEEDVLGAEAPGDHELTRRRARSAARSSRAPRKKKSLASMPALKCTPACGPSKK